RSAWRKPTLLGLAHECQKVERLAQASWDVPLNGTVTDKRWYVAEGTPLQSTAPK
ncbi:5-formyltetrahydrofolate cyclo-ligase, partial [Pseudomonas gessardii]|nr:5-formyltetrahydrofolate cyclo-ligase [Pseudomonas gessardii]